MSRSMAEGKYRNKVPNRRYVAKSNPTLLNRETSLNNKVSIGDYVKLGDLGGTPFPKLMRGTIQRVVAVRSVDSKTQVQITRLHKRRNVTCWVDASLIEKILLPEEVFPISACPVHAPHRKDSGEDSFRRQFCLICKEKSRCHFYQNKVGDEL